MVPRKDPSAEPAPPHYPAQTHEKKKGDSSSKNPLLILDLKSRFPRGKFGILKGKIITAGKKKKKRLSRRKLWNSL